PIRPPSRERPKRSPAPSATPSPSSIDASASSLPCRSQRWDNSPSKKKSRRSAAHSHGDYTSYAGPGLRSPPAQAPVVSRPLPYALDLSRHGDRSRPRPLRARLGRFRQPLPEWHHEHPDRHRPHHHDVSAVGEGPLREAQR